MNVAQSRRAMLSGVALATAGVVLPTVGPAATEVPRAANRPALQPDFPGKGRVPWIRRLFHLYSGEDGLTRIERLPVEVPPNDVAAQLLRRTAARVTVGGSPPGYGWDFHVANYPTLLIPIFGTTVITLNDGAGYELGHGDMAIAEDCTGKGHVSRAGAEGCLIVQVQLPKELCPSGGSSDMTRFWSE